ncbi:DUF222 domain-containing protein [Isoptericola sp. F-RaC21]|uniref:HNH endonuclease signature motif containing protein n=1 Tax=Isoptericola sp. F-RaC21 TaxID=3141452 RepID=UPI00315BF817
MTTTHPDPATGADVSAGSGASTSMDLQATADRIAAMPWSWTPSISELLAEESERVRASAGHDATTCDTDTGQVRQDAPGAFDARPPRPSLADLDLVLDELAANDARLAAVHAERAALLARAAGLAEALETDLLDQHDPTARRAPSARRLELARRAVTAEIATTLHLGEHAAGALADHAVTLTGKAPATLAALRDGRLSWAHAAAISKHLADLAPDDAAAVERSVLAAALDPSTGMITCTPTQLSRRAVHAREISHPTPADVRHAEAADRRAVFLDEGRDGMAWLVAHLPAPLAHAAHDRLTRAARHLRAEDDPRTLDQARADTLAALLLDDGTLDVEAVPTVEPVETTDRVPTPAPGATISTTLATLARSVRPQVTVTVPVLSLLGLADAPATLDGHVPIDPDTARRLAALAPSFRRILTHPESGAVLSVGRTAYTVPTDLKHLVQARDATCRFPGCTRPAQGSDLDHTTAWADGGATAATNLAVLCRRHHVVKHQTTWRVRQVGTTRTDGSHVGWGGTLEWTSPTGRRHVTRPDPIDVTRHRSMPCGHEPPDDDRDAPSDVPPPAAPPPPDPASPPWLDPPF